MKKLVVLFLSLAMLCSGITMFTALGDSNNYSPDFTIHSDAPTIGARDIGAGQYTVTAESAHWGQRLSYNNKIAIEDFSIKFTNFSRAAGQEIVMLLGAKPDDNFQTEGNKISPLCIKLMDKDVMLYPVNPGKTPYGAISFDENFSSLEISAKFASDDSGDLVVTANGKSLTIPAAEISKTAVQSKDSPLSIIFVTNFGGGSFAFDITEISSPTTPDIPSVVPSDDFMQIGSNIAAYDNANGGYRITGTNAAGGDWANRTHFKTALTADNLHLRFTELSLPESGMAVTVGNSGGAWYNDPTLTLLLKAQSLEVYVGGVAGATPVGTISFDAPLQTADIYLDVTDEGGLVVTANSKTATISKAVMDTCTSFKDAEGKSYVGFGMHNNGGDLSVKLAAIENVLPEDPGGTGDASNANTAFGWKGQSAKAKAEDTDKGVKITFNKSFFDNPTATHFDSIATKGKKKLDGLHIQVKNIVLGEAQACLNVALTKDPYVIVNNSLIFLINNYGANINPENAMELLWPLGSSSPKSVGLRNDLIDIYFVKDANGDFITYATSNNSIIGRFKKADIANIFGSDDPEVYVNLSDKWYNAGDNVNSCVVTACNSGTENAFAAFYNEYPAGTEIRKRIIDVTQTGTLEGMTIYFTDNQGGMTTTIRKVALDGLTIAGVELDYNSLFRLSTSYGTSIDSSFEGEGPLFRVDENGDVYITYLRGVGGDDDKLGTFSNPKEKFSIECFQTADGGFNFFITGDVSGESFVKTVSKDDVLELFGTTENIMVHISYSELDRSENTVPKITKIAKISTATAGVVNTPVKAEDISAAIDGNKVTATLKKAAGMAYTYQWYANSGTNAASGGEKIDGATSASYTIPSGWPAGDYYVYCEITSVSKRGETASASTNTVKYTVAEEKEETGSSSNQDDEENAETGDSFGFAGAALILLIAASATMILYRKKREA